MRLLRAGRGRRALLLCAAALLVYGAVGVAINLRLLALLLDALASWTGSRSAFSPPTSLSFLEPLRAHFDSVPWLPWAAWLAGISLLAWAYHFASPPEGGTLADNRRWTFLRSKWFVAAVLAALVAVGGAARMSELWPQSYGITRLPYDDEGVYAGAAQLFLQGYMPYRDYFFAHPPVAAIAYAPALVYHFTEWGSPTSFMLARYLSVFYSLVTLALLFLIGRQLAGLWGGLMAGGLWAIDGRVVEINRKIMLEGPLVLFSCAAVLFYLWVRPALSQRDDAAHARRTVLLLFFAGVAGALAALTKIAGLACLLAIVVDLVWLHVERRGVPAVPHEPRPRRSLWVQLSPLLGGAVMAAALAGLPFLVMAPSQMVREVFFFQMLRPSDGVIDTPARIGDLTATLANALTPLAAAVGFVLLSVWAWLRRGLGPWRTGILWTFFSLLLFTYSRSFYQHYYIQLAAPLAILGAGVSLAPELLRSLPKRLSGRAWSVGLPAAAAVVSLPLVALQWMGMTTRDCPHCQDPMFEVVGRYVNNAVHPDQAVLATDEQFNFLAARQPSRNDTGFLIDSYGHMIYLGLSLGTRDWGDLLASTLKGSHGNDPYIVMRAPAPQADFLDRASRASLIVVHDRGRARLAPGTLEAISAAYKQAEQTSRYTVWRAP